MRPFWKSAILQGYRLCKILTLCQKLKLQNEWNCYTVDILCMICYCMRQACYMPTTWLTIHWSSQRFKLKHEPSSSVFTHLNCILGINANILLLLLCLQFLTKCPLSWIFKIGLCFFETPQNTFTSVCLWWNKKDISCKFSLLTRILHFWPSGSGLKQSWI